MRALATLLVGAVLLAGCSEPTPMDAPGPQGNAAVQQTKAFAAPMWEVGQWWDHQWSLYSGGNVTLQFTVRTVVAQDADGAWLLAAANRSHAAYHGAFTFPTLGRFAKDSLTATAEESTFPWYRFPFQVNDTWQAQVTTLDGIETTTKHDVEVRALDSATIGGSPGHPLVEMREKGTLFARYDYDERAGWFSDAFFYDGSGEVQFRVQRLATGKGHTGTVHDAVGELAVNTAFVVAPGTVQGAPVTTFEVPTGRSHVLAFMFAFAATGAQAAELVDPAATRYSVQAADVNGQSFLPGGAELLVPGVAGDWTFGTAGGGVASGGGILAYAVDLRPIEL